MAYRAVHFICYKVSFLTAVINLFKMFLLIGAINRTSGFGWNRNNM